MNFPEEENLATFLENYLTENYPEKASDLSFINHRGHLAKDKFDLIYSQTKDFNLAYDLAMGVLLEGYLFSKRDLITEILLSKFKIQYPNKKKLKEILINIEKECAPIFDKYNLSDEMLLKNNVVSLENELIDFFPTLDKVQHLKKQ